MEVILCKNCQYPLELNFCPQCGQKATVGPISLKRLLMELPHSVFHVDRGILFNLIQLLIRPGVAIREYLSGKRKPYFHPASFLVVALILNYLVVRLEDLHFYDSEELKFMSPMEAKAILDYDGMQWWFLEHTYIYILLAIPVSSVFLFFVLRAMRQQFNIAETAVVVLFILAEGVMIQTTIYACFGWINSGPFLRTMETVNTSILVLYASFVIYSLSNLNRFSGLRIMMAVVGGLGLTISGIGCALLLYKLLGD